MSSVDSDVNCPNCGFEEANQSWNSAGWMQTFCPRCGYSATRDYNKEGSDEIKGGVGSFRMTYYTHVSSLGGLQAPKSIAGLKRDFRRAMRSMAVKRLEFTLNVNGEWKKFVVKDYPMPGPKKIEKGAKAKGASKRNLKPSLASAPRELKLEDMSEDIPF